MHPHLAFRHLSTAVLTTSAATTTTTTTSFTEKTYYLNTDLVLVKFIGQNVKVSNHNHVSNG